MEKNVFYFPVWGKNYIKLFENYALKCLYINLSKINKNKLKSSKIEIWTFEKDKSKINSLKYIKLLKKIIHINIESIDLIYNSLKDRGLSKYLTLSIMQKIFINSHSYRYRYLWFIYPDFIFSSDLIKNFSNIKKNYDAYFIPVPQLIEEKINNIFINQNFQITSQNITKLFFKYLHPIVKICNVDNSKTNTPSLFFSSNNNSYAFKYFHMHPIIIKSDIKNLEMNNNIYTSLDEGLVESLSGKKLFITKNNFFAICISLLKENEYVLPKEKFNLKKSYEWCIAHVNKTHIDISKSTYFINKYKNAKIDKKLEKKINLRLIPILKKLLKPISAKTYRENVFKKASFFSNMQLKTLLTMDLIKFNEEIYSLIRNNYFKSYFKLDSIKLKKKILNNNKFDKKIFKWLKKLYAKNL